MIVLKLMLAWLVLSLVVGILLGRCIRFGMGEEEENEYGEC